MLGPHGVAVAAHADHGDMIAFGDVWARDILTEEIIAFGNVAGHGDTPGRGRVGLRRTTNSWSCPWMRWSFGTFQPQSRPTHIVPMRCSTETTCATSRPASMV